MNPETIAEQLLSPPVINLKRRNKELEKQLEDQARIERELAEKEPKTEQEIATEQFNEDQNQGKEEETKEVAKVNQLSNKQININEEKCENCGKVNSLVVKQHEGTLVCKHCGLIHQSSMIDQANEKRNFSSENSGTDGNTSRVNARVNQFLPSLGLNTMISGNNAATKELNKQNYPKVSTYEKNITEG